MLIGLLFSCLSVSAQVKPIYFYGNQITQDKDKATSYAVYGKLSTENVWTFKRYDLWDNLLQTGSYSDETLTVAHGKFLFYSDIQEFNNNYLTRYVIKGKTRFLSQEGYFENGLEQGKWILYFPDGNIFNVQELANGKRNGKFITYDKHGVELIAGNYVDNLKDGEWLLEKGKVREIWDMGVLKSREKIKNKKVVQGTVTTKKS